MGDLTLITTHEILVIDGGRIIERGIHAELLALGQRYAGDVGFAAEFRVIYGFSGYGPRGISASSYINNSENVAFTPGRTVEKLVTFVPGAPLYAINHFRATLRLCLATADVGKLEEGV